MKANNNEGEAVRLEYLAAQNFGPIEKAEVDFELGDVFVVAGGNGRGKTTLSSWLFDVLREKFPAKPLREGALAGSYKAKFSNGVSVYYNFDADRNVLEFYGPDQRQLTKKAARDFVREIVGNREAGFDLDGFLRETQPAKRRKALESLVDCNFDKLEETVAAAEEKRKQAKRDRDVQRARAIDYDREAASAEKIDAAAALEDLEAMKAAKSKRESIEAEIARDNAEAAREDEAAKEIEREIEALRIKAAAKREAAKTARTNAGKKEKEAAKIEVPPAEEFARLEETIRSASDRNAAIDRARATAKEHDVLKEKEAEVVTAEAEVEEARKAKADAMAAAALPGGLAFDPDREGGLLLNGKPIEQAAASEVAIAGLTLKLRELDGLRFVHFDASLLDYGNAGRVLEWLEGEGFQACIEIATRRKSESELRIEVAEKFFE